ncbi:Phosphotyrosyl phosphatase activator [Trichocladium antarcticum]|uniref:Serine/threonine-protein phosphatase 2A activator n=1 Tax=Trichocladium antarcticum TaxID=1450529 RepID=A0AAN6UE06_9PEZI|nr:Phosphotyrosyl phosphatase activator [Trichocladium antarcticum]
MEPPPPAAAPTSRSRSPAPAPNPPSALPHLPLLPPSHPHTFLTPTKKIHTGADLTHFLASRAHHDICAFIHQLNRALVPRKTPPITTKDNPEETETETKGGRVQTFPLTAAPRADPDAVRRLQGLLQQVEAIVDEVPPETGPRRFGNAAFRSWFDVLEGRVAGLLRGYLRAQRLDYGTGHELSFLAFLGGLWKLGVFGAGSRDGEVERSLVLGVFEQYLKVVRRLILTYNLEPAGTHGVWGLDDHAFLPYIFGSAQLSRPIADAEPVPLEGSLPGAPKPSAIAKPASVEMYRDSNMYFAAVGFINDVKKGPFWEHSPLLYDISGIKDGWGKVNKGMIKMFSGEVLGKFPVVQHFPFGSLFSWDLDPDAEAPLQSVHLGTHDAAGTGSGAGPGPGTAAPWQQPAGGMPGAGAGAGVGPGTGAGLPTGPGLLYSRAPWAQTGSAGPSMPRGGAPNTGPPPPTAFPRGMPGQASNQFSVTKAPWARD